MKVNRINLFIPRSENTHVRLLNNECLALMNQYKFGGIYSNDGIKFNSAPEEILKVLKKLKIKFERA